MLVKWFLILVSGRTFLELSLLLTTRQCSAQQELSLYSIASPLLTSMPVLMASRPSQATSWNTGRYFQQNSSLASSRRQHTCLLNFLCTFIWAWWTRPEKKRKGTALFSLDCYSFSVIYHLIIPGSVSLCPSQSKGRTAGGAQARAWVHLLLQHCSPSSVSLSFYCILQD